MRLGSLCSGYAGLDLAVEEMLGARAVWHAEVDADASRVLAGHWPDVPNHGDLAAVDWASVEPVDVVTAGWPCQPFSVAGKRKGAQDERAIWPAVAHAVRVLRPRLVVLENVPGILTAGELARAAADLAALGYVGSWRCVRASTVGAPHRRERVFIAAHTPGSGLEAGRERRAGRGVAADAAGIGHGNAGSEGGRGVPAAAVAGDPRSGVALLPTPAARPGERWGQPNAETAAWRMGVEGRRNLEDAVALLPTPRASDGVKGGPNQRGSSGDVALPAAVQRHRMGKYADAVARWEHVLGRPAPDPTEPGAKGQPRLSPRFVEWMQGLPAGWVTDLVSRNAALRILGNGVVPQQATYALSLLLPMLEAAA